MPHPRIPKQVKVGPHVYRIRLVNAKVIPGLNGNTDHDALLILIHKRIPISKKRVVLVHEICHCIHALQYGPFDTEPHPDEIWIEATAGMLVQVLRDNPRLVEYLLYEEDPVE